MRLPTIVAPTRWLVSIGAMTVLVAGCSVTSLSSSSPSSPATSDPSPGTDGGMSSQDATTAATAVESSSTAGPPTSAQSAGGDGAIPAAPSTAPVTTGNPEEFEVYQLELVLSPSGIGAREFGTNPAEVIKYVRSLLGAPTKDTNWIDAVDYPACPGTEVRVVEWGVLSLQFSNSSPIKQQGRHFFGWTYGNPNEIGESPEGLTTAQDVSTGSSTADLKAVFDNVAITEGDPDTAFPDSFFVPKQYWGLLSGPTDDDVVTQISSELGCGA